jgi:hypothetical protein
MMTNQDLPWYRATFAAYKHEISDSLWSLLGDLLDEKPFLDLLSHPYFLEEIDGDPNSSIDLTPIFGSGDELAALDNLRRAAWKSLPYHTRHWLISCGANDLSRQEDREDPCLSRL